MTLEEKKKIGTSFMALAMNETEPEVIENLLKTMMGCCILNGAKPEEMLEIICLGTNEVHIQSIADEFLKAMDSNKDKSGYESYIKHTKMIKDVGNMLDMSEAVNGILLPYNMIFGEAMVKVGQAIMSKPDFFKGD